MIKQILKKIIVFLLQTEAKLILRKYKPKIVAVSGTVGKTSAKDAIALVLGNKFSVRKSEKSYNSEIGVPLTIIGARSAWNNFFQWIFILFKGLKVFFREKNYPQWLILEMGVDRPKDMERLVKWIRPDIAIITTLVEIPVHVEYFKGPEELIKEKIKLIKKLKPENYAILNGDDKILPELKEKTEANIITYGFSENLDLIASNYHLSSEGITFKIDYKGNIVPIRIPGVFGRQYVYSALTGITVGISQGLNLVEAAEALSKFKPPPGRLNLIEGIKNSFIFDDSYNSSPIAAAAALEALKELSEYMSTIKPGRKIAVLGDMLELGKFTIDEHKKVGKLVKEIGADLLFTVGPRSKFTTEEAQAVGFDPKNIFEFSTSDEAKKAVQEKIQENDLILVKGSQSMRMEKIVEEIMAHPELKEQLLARQEKEWQNR
ncbi:MAG: UDP-N-acetylmuramoyl-tripeptide--D-alanyl-D-alanine ligase [Candidatus Terrybacteria bacterium]|nr:UDP-N-acetylmuramoyl-tripeptide--D-alanyl-D-alanine ligase [Candidatus Terrybacteria bacterium]